MRASMLIVAVGTCLVAACSGNGGGTGTSSSGITFTNKGCALTFSGTYTFTYTELSGNCGMIQPIHETVNGMASGAGLSSACQSGSGTDVATPSASGGCSFTANFSGCQLPNTNDTFDLSEQVDWNAAYTSATGTFSTSIMGAGACSGTYSIAITQP